MTPVLRLNLARLLIAAVLLMNVQCAVLFLVLPGPYAAGFDMPGPLGEAMLRGMGVLFLMWNVPYAVAYGIRVVCVQPYMKPWLCRPSGWQARAWCAACFPQNTCWRNSRSAASSCSTPWGCWL